MRKNNSESSKSRKRTKKLSISFDSDVREWYDSLLNGTKVFAVNDILRRGINTFGHDHETLMIRQEQLDLELSTIQLGMMTVYGKLDLVLAQNQDLHEQLEIQRAMLDLAIERGLISQPELAELLQPESRQAPKLQEQSEAQEPSSPECT